MENQLYDIPRRINDPPKLFFFDLDISLCFISGFFFGAMFDALITGSVIGFLLAMAFAKLKTGKHPYFSVHLMYWHLPPIAMKLRRTPPSYIREMKG